MTKYEKMLVELTHDDLVSEFYTMVVTATNQENFRKGGCTAKVDKSIESCQNEILRRLYGK